MKDHLSTRVIRLSASDSNVQCRLSSSIQDIHHRSSILEFLQENGVR